MIVRRLFIRTAQYLGASILIFSSFTQTAFAGSIFLSPSSGAYTVGQTFRVNLNVNTDVPANAISATVSYTKNILTLVSSSISGSIVSLWPQQMVATQSTPSFAGIMLNPGYTGSSGRILTLNFRADAPGTGSVKLSNGQLLANDGTGTSILNGMSGGSYEITPKKETPPPAPSVVSPTTPIVVTEQPAPVILAPDELQPPIFTSVPKLLPPNQYFVVKGTTATGTTVTVWLQNAEGLSTKVNAMINPDGTFIATFPDPLIVGEYETVAVAQSHGKKSDPSTMYHIVVKKPSLLSWLDPMTTAMMLGFSTFFFLVGFILMVITRDRAVKGKKVKKIKLG